jgi:hypothetical protein
VFTFGGGTVYTCSDESSPSARMLTRSGRKSQGDHDSPASSPPASPSRLPQRRDVARFECDPGTGCLTKNGTRNLLIAFEGLEARLSETEGHLRKALERIDDMHIDQKRSFERVFDLLEKPTSSKDEAVQSGSEIETIPVPGTVVVSGNPAPPNGSIYVTRQANCFHFGDSNSRDLEPFIKVMPGWTQVIRCRGIYEATQSVDRIWYSDGSVPTVDVLQFSCTTNDVSENFPLEWYKSRVTELVSVCKRRFASAKICVFVPHPRNDCAELCAKSAQVSQMLTESFPDIVRQVPEFIPHLDRCTDESFLRSDGFHLTPKAKVYFAACMNAIAQLYLKPKPQGEKTFCERFLSVVTSNIPPRSVPASRPATQGVFFRGRGVRRPRGGNVYRGGFVSRSGYQGQRPRPNQFSDVDPAVEQRAIGVTRDGGFRSERNNSELMRRIWDTINAFDRGAL